MSRQDDAQRPIIIRRKKGRHGGVHGGAWKIAYADFVTAMMAFFLLMWLLGSTTQGELQGIADYFKNPIKVSLRGGSGSGDSSSVIQGGGQDLTRRHSQTKHGEIAERKKTVNLKAAQAEIERLELEQLYHLKARLEAAIEGNPTTQAFRRQLMIDITDEGLRVQILDEQNRPMFELGRAQVLSHTKEILREIAEVLNEVPNRLSLAGHTDAKAYVGGERGYSNWELSSDRANASRRELMAGGLEEGKIVRVTGLASSVLYNSTDPYDPVNRRISIIVLNKRTERRVMSDGDLIEVEADQPDTREALVSAIEDRVPAAGRELESSP